MTYTVHKEGRPFRTCADLNKARECINENGGDGHGAAAKALILRRKKIYSEKVAKAAIYGDYDKMHRMEDCEHAIIELFYDFNGAGLINKDGEQWTIK